MSTSGGWRWTAWPPTALVALRGLPAAPGGAAVPVPRSETWRGSGAWRGGGAGSLILFGLPSAVILVAGLRRERRALMAPEPGSRCGRRLPDARGGARPEGRDARVPRSTAPPGSTWRSASASRSASGARGGRRDGVTFAVLGILIVTAASPRSGSAGAHVLLAASIQGREVVLTEALVRVASILGGFASLYFVAVGRRLPQPRGVSWTTSWSGCAA